MTLDHHFRLFLQKVFRLLHRHQSDPMRELERTIEKTTWGRERRWEQKREVFLNWFWAEMKQEVTPLCIATETRKGHSSEGEVREKMERERYSADLLQEECPWEVLDLESQRREGGWVGRSRRTRWRSVCLNLVESIRMMERINRPCPMRLRSHKMRFCSHGGCGEWIVSDGMSLGMGYRGKRANPPREGFDISHNLLWNSGEHEEEAIDSV
jgi:hypothetical protein